MRPGWGARLALARTRTRALALAGLLATAAPFTAAKAASLRSCDITQSVTAAQQDRLLRFAAFIKAELAASGQRVALVARSGLNLARFGQRYSHGGVSLLGSGNTAWSVRQLYYACDEAMPRLFDQGLAGFVAGADDPDLGFFSALLLPTEAAAPLETRALNDRLALQLLGSRYSANAHAFSTRYQNCNQWLIETLALAWSGRAGLAARTDTDTDTDTASLRAVAQDWLRRQGFEPTRFEVGRPLVWLTPFSPWLHDDDHPAADRQQALYQVSMPAAIEAFAVARFPASQRLEFCHTPTHLLLRRNGPPIDAACTATATDTVQTLGSASASASPSPSTSTSTSASTSASKLGSTPAPYPQDSKFMPDRSALP